jgi:hypothetical protein
MQSRTGRLTGLWFLPKPAQGLNTTENYQLGQSVQLLNANLLVHHAISRLSKFNVTGNTHISFPT